MKRYKRRSSNSNGAIIVESAADIIVAALRPALISKAGCIRTGNTRNSRFFIWPTGRVRIAAPIGLVQHKEHERIGEAQKAIQGTLPFVLEIAY
jgi:hypothetical protein